MKLKPTVNFPFFAVVYIFCLFGFTYIGRNLSNTLVEYDLLFSVLIVCFVFFGCSCVLYLDKAFKNRDFFSYALLFMVGIISLMMIFKIKYPVEKIHFIEYGILVLLLRKAFFGKLPVYNQYMLSIMAAGLVGLLDEIFQYYLPLRFFDWRDVGINFFSSFLALAGYEIAHNQTGFFRLSQLNRRT